METGLEVDKGPRLDRSSISLEGVDRVPVVLNKPLRPWIINRTALTSIFSSPEVRQQGEA